MKINVDRDELAQVEALLPESAKVLVSVLGYATTSRLIDRLGGVTLPAKSGMAQERTGGVHVMLREVLTEEEVSKLMAYLGGDWFYIPRCEAALRKLRNVRFIAAVAERQEMGLSIRQAMAVLCPQFGISDRIGWKLISRRASEDKRKQPGLF
ncbi:Mor transcription activator family protein [Enterobacter mori]|uniref:Mor transcription activator family protein n=1 Tax=Enterobacter mori TaxID=539813 RepID=UPI003B842A6B